MDQNKAKEVRDVSDKNLILFYALVGLIILVALCCGPLIPIWMFFNSLQLIAHIPLIRAALPASANLFLIDLLSVVRLNFGKLEEALA